MLFAYQIFGNFDSTVKETDALLSEVGKAFEPWESLISRTVFLEKEKKVFSSLYICKDKETALLAQKRVQELVEKNEEHVGFTTEFIFEIKEEKNYS